MLPADSLLEAFPPAFNSDEPRGRDPAWLVPNFIQVVTRKDKKAKRMARTVVVA
jgi:hypothetical protein